MRLSQAFRRHFVIAAMLLSIAALPAFSQTIENLNKKYPRLDANHYQLRPDAILTVKFAEDGQICEMEIEPKTVFDARSVPDESRELPRVLMTVGEAEKLIDELVPDYQRGQSLHNGRGFSFESGCNEVTLIEYEHVIIQRVFHHCQKQFGEVVSITIQRKEAKCNAIIKRLIRDKNGIGSRFIK